MNTQPNFDEIRQNAIAKLKSRIPDDKQGKFGEFMMAHVWDAAASVCLEMLKEYHKSLQPLQTTDKAPR